MRIVFTGGGTGGHIFPNIAVINELKKKNSSAEIFYIGEKKSMEEKIVRSETVPFYGIHAGKLRRYVDVKNIIDAFKVPLGVIEAYLHLRTIKPDLVFSKGGYVSVPVVFAAGMLGIPVWIHESDLSPGLATRITRRYAQKIFLSFEESKRFFENGEVVGNPIRAEMYQGKKERGYAFTGFSEKLPTILIMGGSSGAQSLNKLVSKILQKLLEVAQVVHLTGEHTVAIPAHVPSVHAARYKSFAFLHERLADVYAISDLVVSRAGSGSLFEILANKAPTLLVPLPLEGSRGDQIENAASFSRHGFALALDQESTTPELFLKEIQELLTDKHARTAMFDAQKKAHPENAAKIIVEHLLMAF